MDDLEQFARKSPHPGALASVQEARAGLEKLIHKMDGLEAGFDRIAERSRKQLSRNERGHPLTYAFSVLSSSRLFEHRRRSKFFILMILRF